MIKIIFSIFILCVYLNAAAGSADDAEIATPTAVHSVFTHSADMEDSQVEDFTYFDVYAAIADIATTQGHTYDDYTSLKTHPGPEKTRELIQSLLEAIIKKEKGVLNYMAVLYEKLLALDPADYQNKEAYIRLDPVLADERLYQEEPQAWYENFKMEFNLEPFVEVVKVYESLLMIMKDESFCEVRWDDFFSNCTRFLNQIITQQETGKVIPTSYEDLLLMHHYKCYWSLHEAQRGIAMASLYVSLMRLSLAHVNKSTIISKKKVLITYGVDKLLYLHNRELEEHPISPSSLVMNKYTRKERLIDLYTRKALSMAPTPGKITGRFQLELPHTPEEITLWREIEEGSHQRAMPKPFGTRARIQKELADARKVLERQAKKQAEDAYRKLEEELSAAASPSASLSKAARKRAAKKERAVFYTRESADGAPAGAGISQEKREASTCIPLDSIVGVAKPASLDVEEGVAGADEKPVSATPFTPQDIREKTLQLAMRMSTAADRLQLLPEKSFCPVKWVKHHSEDRYLPEPFGMFDLTHAQHTVLAAIRKQTPYAFNMDGFLNLMAGLGIPYRGQKGSHVSIHSPGRPDKMPKIFVDPHGGCTDKFGAAAMEDMLMLINGLSLGEGSELIAP